MPNSYCIDQEMTDLSQSFVHSVVVTKACLLSKCVIFNKIIVSKNELFT